ncbi:N-acetyl-gamma-glutamyl-phosphate reductase [Lysobacter arvi]|uniref:N-acetyl-gamma-glutamyl-phosphate reductase n=1 Tax=Lysobacter arvi TaxID=3038776 RepID=A0ABU1C8I5_9GAMM|nr:N-acetyl-gamma-glutamyl-phosphate reductase [Lysobacter arvi]MDR0181482.1 N-acetyl-gamma-glutamyl-phosphate reductase [Lysobacter arvi]
MSRSVTGTSVGIVGARGYVGAELIRLIAGHPDFELAFVSSRELAGQRVADQFDGVAGIDPELRYVAPSNEELPTLGADAIVLALPNGKAAACVAAFDEAGVDPVIVDLSADYRFDDAWYYGLPELTRAKYAGQRRISNPGCYATAMQLAVAPMLDALAGPVQCFGVSGYSGAGTTPSDKNDPEKLRDNLMPYALTNHVHEREVTRQLGHEVQFLPHVAPHFRGLTITANLTLSSSLDRDQVVARYRDRYAGEPLVDVLDDAPWVSRIAGQHHVELGGFTLSPDGRRLVVVATEDNLLKGAATQALQNLNLAFGFDENRGIPRVRDAG